MRPTCDSGDVAHERRRSARCRTGPISAALAVSAAVEPLRLVAQPLGVVVGRRQPARVGLEQAGDHLVGLRGRPAVARPTAARTASLRRCCARTPDGRERRSSAATGARPARRSPWMTAATAGGAVSSAAARSAALISIVASSVRRASLASPMSGAERIKKAAPRQVTDGHGRTGARAHGARRPPGAVRFEAVALQGRARVVSGARVDRLRSADIRISASAASVS